LAVAVLEAQAMVPVEKEIMLYLAPLLLLAAVPVLEVPVKQTLMVVRAAAVLEVPVLVQIQKA